MASDRLQRLRNLRDLLLARMADADGSHLAALSKQYRDTLIELDELAPDEDTPQSKIRERYGFDGASGH